MNWFLAFILLFASTAVHAETCPTKSHWVKAFHRKAYYRADGTFVSETDVAAHCQKNSTAYDFWREKLKSGLPPGWPNKSEAAVPGPPQKRSEY